MEQTKKLEILVVEDKPYHLENAKYFFSQQKEKLAQYGIELNVYYATTKSEAVKSLSENHLDGVVSDLHFPNFTGGKEQFLGFELGKEHVNSKGIPIVFVTDLNAHGRDNHWILDEATKEWDYRNVFHYDEDYVNEEETHKPGKSKPFALAFFNLLSLVESKSTYKTLGYSNLKDWVEGMYYSGRTKGTAAVEKIIGYMEEELQKGKFREDEKPIIETLIKYAK